MKNLFLSLLVVLTIAGCKSELNGSDVPPNAATSLTISRSSTTLQTGQCQTGFTVTRINSSGSPVAEATAMSVVLSGQGSGSFYSDSACASVLADRTVVIPAGAASVGFSFKNDQPENLTFSATASGLTSSSTNFSVQPTLAITTAPAGNACVNFSTQPVVTVQNGLNATVTTAQDSVTLVAYSDAACATTAPGTLTGNSVTAVSGVATFTALRYSVPGTIYLKAQSGSSAASSCSSAVTVTSTGATKLGFTAQDSTATAGTAFAATVAVQDACGTTVTSATSPTLSLAAFSDSGCTSAVSGGTFSGGTATAPTSGAVAFTPSYTVATPIYLKATATGNTLTAACSSAATTIQAGAPNKLAVLTTTSPNSGACSPAYTVGLQDAHGNSATATSPTSVTLTNVGGSNVVYYSDSACANSITSININSSSSTATFYLKDATSEAITVGATATGLTGGSLDVFAGTGTTIEAFSNSGDWACTWFFATPTTAGLYTGGVCYENDSSASHWIIRRSTDQGANWTTLDDYLLDAGGDYNAPNAFAVDPSNTSILYAAGGGADGNGAYPWIIRRSTDGGTTWTTVDNYDLDGSGSEAYAITVASDGAVYATGFSYDTNGDTHGIVRKSTNGTTFTLVDTYPNPGTASQGFTILADGTQNIIAAGYYADATEDNYWYVRKSTDAGATWNDLSNNYVYPGGSDFAAPFAIMKAANNDLFLAGYANDSGGIQHGIVRKSTDGGATWTTVDDIQPTGGGSRAAAFGLTQNTATGDIYVAGITGNSDDQSRHLLIRKSTDNGTTWTTFDDWFLALGQSSRAWGGAKYDSTSGKLFVSGEAADADGTNYGLVRMY